MHAYHSFQNIQILIQSLMECFFASSGFASNVARYEGNAKALITAQPRG